MDLYVAPERLTLIASQAPLPEPLYFGAGNASLFGMLHECAEQARRGTGVVLCPPLGEELFGAHRAFRVLATQLSRRGFPVLRFDYEGCGDSSGDDLGVTMDSCVASTLAAAGYLAARPGIERVVLAGLRFGATVATLSAARMTSTPIDLVLWDPILDGAEYVAMLRSELRRSLERHVVLNPLEDAGVSSFEAVGQRITTVFEAQLAAIAPDIYSTARPGSTLLLDTSGLCLPRVRTFSERHPLRHCLQLELPEGRWTPQRSEGPLVPAAMLNRLVAEGAKRW